MSLTKLILQKKQMIVEHILASLGMDNSVFVKGCYLIKNSDITKDARLKVDEVEVKMGSNGLALLLRIIEKGAPVEDYIITQVEVSLDELAMIADKMVRQKLIKEYAPVPDFIFDGTLDFPDVTFELHPTKLVKGERVICEEQEATGWTVFGDFHEGELAMATARTKELGEQMHSFIEQ